MRYEVIFYEDGRCISPVKNFLNDLHEKAKTNKLDLQLFEKIVYYIEILEQSGTRAGMPYTKHVKEGIWELRPRDYRVLFFVSKNKIVLLHAFRKTTKKTPILQIKRAKKEMNDWLNRIKS